MTLNNAGCRNRRCPGRLGLRHRPPPPPPPPPPAAPATTTAATAGTRLPGPGLVDCQATSIVLLVMKGIDRRPCFGIGAHLDEPEAFAPASVAVGDDLRALNAAVL